jgi:t-SNARE complex subunit (syntaxin)
MFSEVDMEQMHNEIQDIKNTLVKLTDLAEKMVEMQTRQEEHSKALDRFSVIQAGHATRLTDVEKKAPLWDLAKTVAFAQVGVICFAVISALVGVVVL